ncbi:MAG TPA: hypothetical protein VLT59_17105 [Steroidobacteraceae bacterium]|nr:hypothetical protein [Steroidobacteraceae bacterium]
MTSSSGIALALSALLALAGCGTDDNEGVAETEYDTDTGIVEDNYGVTDDDAVASGGTYGDTETYGDTQGYGDTDTDVAGMEGRDTETEGMMGAEHDMPGGMESDDMTMQSGSDSPMMAEAESDYADARERCQTLDGDARDQCLQAAREQFESATDRAAQTEDQQ